MPRGLNRFYGSGDLHFITCSCYQRQALLGTAPRRDLFSRVLEQVRRSYHFVLLGYVVMPEHFHLLISEPQRGNPSTVMQALKLAFTRQLLGEQRRSHKAAEPWLESRHFWQPRFYDFNVWTEYKRVEKLRYLHRNPVKRGLVLEPQEWRWSSFRSYFYGETGLVRINDCGLLRMTMASSAGRMRRN